MTETTKNTGDKLSVSSTKTLTLKRGGVEQGVVRQSFSHGRSKAVVVEKVKRRIGPAEGRAEPAAPERSAAPRQAAAPATARAPAPATPAAPAASPKTSGVVLRTLTEEERSARAQALAGAQLREHEERSRAEQEALVRRTREEADRAERAASEALPPAWHKYLRDHQPPVLAVWGKNDPIFPPQGAEAFRRDVPDAEIHLLDTGHFALEEDSAEIASLILDFLGRKLR